MTPGQSYFPASASIVQQDRDLSGQRPTSSSIGQSQDFGSSRIVNQPGRTSAGTGHPDYFSGQSSNLGLGQSSNLGLGQFQDQGILEHQPGRTSAGAGHPDYFGQSGSTNPTLGSSLSGGVSRMEQDALQVKADITKHNTGQVDYDIHAERKPESRIQGEGDHGLRQHAYRMQGQGGNDRA